MAELKRVLVTGAGGFIGRHLVRQLLDEKVAVVALMLPGEPVPDDWDKEVDLVSADIRQLVSRSDDIGEIDAVFHLAAVVSDWGSQEHHVDITVRGTEQAIEIARLREAHFVVTTSVCAYASALGQGELTEDTPVGTPCGPYEFCKQEQERLTRQAVAQHGLKATIVRPGNVFGVGSGPWVNMLVDNLREGKPALLGSGDWDAGLCHVNNLVDILIAAARSEHSAGEVFNAADSFGVTWRTYLHRLAEAAGTPPPQSVPNVVARLTAPVLEWFGKLRRQEERPAVTRQSYRLLGGPNIFRTDRATALLGYRPRVQFEDAMRELAQHYGQDISRDGQPWVWVTGAASGLGRHFTGQLLQKGYRVLATDMKLEALEQARDEDAWYREHVRLEVLDVTKITKWQALLKQCEDEGMAFSHLLNVAGIIRPGNAFENTAREVGRQVEVNLMGTVRGCDTLLPHFRERSAGHFINIASFAGFGPAPGVVGYCTSKAAVRTFTNGLAMDLELAGIPIDVTCVCPDLVATPMMEEQLNYGDHARVVFGGKQPLKTEQVGALVLGKVWDKRPMEVALPWNREWQARLAGLMPAVGLKLFAGMQDKGRERLAQVRAERDAQGD